MQPHTDQPRPALPDPEHATAGNGQHGHEEVIPKDLPKVGTGKVIVATVVIVVLLAALFVIGLVPHRKRVARINAEAAEARDSRPIVNVVHVKRQDHGSELVLPGDVRPFQTTSIFPRANGYLAKQYVDIGDSVKEGQLLAEIDTPEVTAQLAQAKATVQQQEANVAKAKNDNELAQQTFTRYRDFGKTGGVTQQQVDEKNAAASQAQATYDAARATLASANADVQRLTSILGFSKVTAPFGGKITARNFDVGALLSSSGTREMFRVEQNDTLRVYVQVPQVYATAVTIGLPAELVVSNYAGQSFGGKVVRSSDTIDVNTRTIRYEIDVPNPDGKLFAGMYGQIKFQIKPQNPPLIVPTSALVFNDKGLRVATVDSDGKVKFMPISVGRDFGTEVEVETGLKGDERIVANPGERLADGVEVKTVGETGPGGGKTRVAEAEH
jgi:RND family efflux transporter MFP subunit